MAGHDVIVVEVRSGVALRACLDVLDLVAELVEIVPEWHQAKADELAARAVTLADILVAKLKEKP